MHKLALCQLVIAVLKCIHVRIRIARVEGKFDQRVASLVSATACKSLSITSQYTLVGGLPDTQGTLAARKCLTRSVAAIPSLAT